MESPAKTLPLFLGLQYMKQLQSREQLASRTSVTKSRYKSYLLCFSPPHGDIKVRVKGELLIGSRAEQQLSYNFAESKHTVQSHDYGANRSSSTPAASLRLEIGSRGKQQLSPNSCTWGRPLVSAQSHTGILWRLETAYYWFTCREADFLDKLQDAAALGILQSHTRPPTTYHSLSGLAIVHTVASHRAMVHFRTDPAPPGTGSGRLCDWCMRREAAFPEPSPEIEFLQSHNGVADKTCYNTDVIKFSLASWTDGFVCECLERIFRGEMIC